MKTSYFFFFLFALMLLGSAIANAGTEVIVYKSESCGHCGIYLKELKDFLSERSITSITEKSILSDKEALRELDSFTKEHEIPYEMQGHMVTIINNLILEGHIPLDALEDIFNEYPDNNFPETVLFQDSMDAFVTDYKILLKDGSSADCTTNEDFRLCEEKTSGDDKPAGKSFFLLVMFNALLAGVHPCTLSVLLFFIAFLFKLRKSRKGIIKVGIAYIIGIFLAYFGIGLGLFRAVTFASTPHLAAKVGAGLVLALGLFNLISYFSKNKVSLGMPKFVKPTIAELLEKATIPAVFLVGLLVGICSFGCTAGIYLSILSLLLVKTQYIQGLLYLLLYNLMFILPLIVVLAITANKKVVKKLENLEAKESSYLKLVSGIIMIVLALVILWVTLM